MTQRMTDDEIMEAYQYAEHIDQLLPVVREEYAHTKEEWQLRTLTNYLFRVIDEYYSVSSDLESAGSILADWPDERGMEEALYLEWEANR